jgi:hypothetical protein
VKVSGVSPEVMAPIVTSEVELDDRVGARREGQRDLLGGDELPRAPVEAGAQAVGQRVVAAR